MIFLPNINTSYTPDYNLRIMDNRESIKQDLQNYQYMKDRELLWEMALAAVCGSGYESYCVPSALSSATGLTADTIANVIRKIRGKALNTKVVGVSNIDTMKVLDDLGVIYKKVRGFNGYTLDYFIDVNPPGDWLLSIRDSKGSHMIAVSDQKVVDSGAWYSHTPTNYYELPEYKRRGHLKIWNAIQIKGLDRNKIKQLQSTEEDTIDATREKRFVLNMNRFYGKKKLNKPYVHCILLIQDGSLRMLHYEKCEDPYKLAKLLHYEYRDLNKVNNLFNNSAEIKAMYGNGEFKVKPGKPFAYDNADWYRSEIMGYTGEGAIFISNNAQSRNGWFAAKVVNDKRYIFKMQHSYIRKFFS